MEKAIFFEIRNHNDRIIYKIKINPSFDELLINITKYRNGIYNYYENTFTLKDLQVVKYFTIYDNIEECMDDIISGINTNQSLIKKENNKLKLIIPLLNKKYPTISFTLNEKSKDKMINEQNMFIEKLQKENYDLKKEFNNLKLKIANYEKNKHKNILVEIVINNIVKKNITFKSNDTINILIELVEQEFGFKNNYSYYEIKYNEQIITNFFKTFEDYKIMNNSTIYFNYYNIGGQYFVKILSGKTITLDLNGNDTVLNIKRKIQNKEGIPIQQQRIIYAGRQLEDNKTILDYQIKSEATFHLAMLHR